MFTRKIDENLQLALLQPSFARSYYRIVRNERDYLSKWLSWPVYADSEAFFLAFISQSLHDYAEGKSLICAIILNGKIIGNIGFNKIHKDLRKVEMGYWLSAEYQGKGIVTTSVSEMICMAFTEYGMEKVQISAAVDNIPSRNVCRRLSFVLEGVVTQAENLNGWIVDHAVYGLNKNNWMTHQGLYHHAEKTTRLADD